MALSTPTTTLTGQTIASSYDQLLFLDAAAGVTEATLKIVSGTAGKTALQISDEHALIKGVDTNNAAAFEVQQTDATSIFKVAADTPAVTISAASTMIQHSGAMGITVGSTGAAGASISLDGDSNGDGAGGDYCYFTHDTDGILNIVQDSPSGTNSIHFGTAGTEDKVVIDSNGRLGIGVTDPDSELEIFHATDPQIKFTINTHGDAGVILADADGLKIYGEGSSNQMRLYTDNTERMRLGSDGTVGIGTTGALATFHVKHTTDDTDENGNIAMTVGGDSSGELRHYWGVNNASNYGYYGVVEHGTAYRPLALQPNGSYVGIGEVAPAVTLDVHADTTETAAVFGQADDGNCYIATRVGEVQNQVCGYIFQVGSAAVAGYGSANTLATMVSAVKNDGGTLTGDLTFAVNGGDSLANRFNIASNGDLTATDTSIGSISDERFKKNIKDYNGGLDTINALRPVTFEHKVSTKLREGTQRGFIAQEVEKVDSFWTRKSIATDEDDFYNLVKDDGAEYYISKITEKDTLYVSAIKELSAQIDALTARVKELETK